MTPQEYFAQGYTPDGQFWMDGWSPNGSSEGLPDFAGAMESYYGKQPEGQEAFNYNGQQLRAVRPGEAVFDQNNIIWDAQRGQYLTTPENVQPDQGFTTGDYLTMLGFAAAPWAMGALSGAGSAADAAAWGGWTEGAGGWLSSLGLDGIGSVGSAVNALGGSSGLGSLLGGALGAMDGSKQAGTTTTTQEPWSPMKPYLMDAANQAKVNYDGQRTMTPQTQEILAQSQRISQDQINNPIFGNMQSAANGIFTGSNSPFQKVEGIKGAPSVSASSGSASNVDAAGAFKALGANDPTKAYQSLLTGDVTSPYLNNIAQDNFTMANRNLMENIMPGIGGEASASGQYGSSRQGIAQGLAASRLNQDVTAANNAMFGNAYQQAQGNMLSAAGQLGSLGMNAATTNANNATNVSMSNANLAQQASMANAANALNAQQFNANLGLQNNTQQLSQMNSAIDWLNSGNNMQNTAIKNSLDLSNYGNTYANNALNQYTGTINPMAGMGGSSSVPYYTNQTAGLLGGAAAGSQIFKNIFN